ncbi:Transposase DDE domain protein [Wolbachia endosymbiont of Cylisticus convexus]|uniref:transposase n=1 Tax=Wolbachia endosymbiont of Cylisticus convexus TaxID=118728 RepID=UPI000E1967AC|nr:transposase [Wolbachia endosymbiont of Cylisticus convexus]RDD33651.1 Transposase DDE domain protein [Wolbachia endosymbiont of Cylisticus convexus]RDD33802.1 Transposase DDE domain protein [Wolbachia endosymbiont of Cylisticus convexus]RDD33809.1 Transposase [Wolbachia endosymbiont of Cylisticus convexus]RDD33812.1 Transposase DDE domain protein [Wolbachia endosymbiont of Cylisticus convexus]RDD33998.1 Transposase DDE domain protein [Wolbachia endosymbiont of Cylisticus convexus]
MSTLITCDLLKKVDFQHVVKVLYADRAYDRHKLYKLCKEYNIKAKILPKTCAAEHLKIDYMSDRNTAIRLIKLHNEDGMKKWKEKVNYGKRSYIEVFFSRLKQTFGFSFRNKSEVNREKELLIKCYLLNKFIEIGVAKFEIAS